jgi:CTP:molybdopterin cytidylyltransferase MocA
MAGPRADVVVLAAGRSSRLGMAKGLVVVEGVRWIVRQLEALGGRRAVVVLSHDRERYLSEVPDLPLRATIAVNPDPERGPFSSLQVGLAALAPAPAPAPALAPVFVLPVDVPAAAPAVWDALEEALAGAAAHAAVPEHEGRGGHPVLLAASFAAEILARPAGSRLDEELRRRGPVLRVPVGDPRVRLNLNAAEDWGKVPVGG